MDEFKQLVVKAINAKTDEQRWLAELQIVLHSDPDPRCEHRLDDRYRFDILFETCRRLNNRVGLVAALLSAGKDISEWADSMVDVHSWAVELHNVVPKQNFWRTEVVSYAKEHQRSWCGIVIEFCQTMISLGNHGLGPRPLEIEYEAKHVEVQLAIEWENVSAHYAKPQEVGPFEPVWLRVIFDCDDNRTLKIRLNNLQREESQRKWFVPASVLDGVGDWKAILFDASAEMNESSKAKVLAFLSTQ